MKTDWYIKITEENREEVIDWYKRTINSSYLRLYGFILNTYYSITDNNEINMNCFENYFKKTLKKKEITLNELLTMNNKLKVGDKVECIGIYVKDLNGWQYLKSELKDNTVKMIVEDKVYFNEKIRGFYLKDFKKMEKMEKREIIGYECPTDLSGSEKIIKKGTIFLKNSDGIYRDRDKSMFIPKEIVETWNPVYAKEDIYLYIGNPKKQIFVSKDSILYQNNEIDIFDLKILHDNLLSINNNTLNDWAININKVQIGCSEFTMDELKSVINAYKSFQ